MAKESLIGWTGGTWNVITGCSIESPGCTNCYAMKLAGSRLRHHPSRVGLTKMTAAGQVWTGEVRFNEQWLKQPLEWKRPQRIFVVAHGDLFHPDVPFEWLDRIFAVMLSASRHTYQILTKRPARALEYLRSLKSPGGYDRLEAAARGIGYTLRHNDIPLVAWPFKGMWFGASVENQRYADERREPMREIAAMGFLTWVSYEPALGSVDWTGWEFLRWFVSGGESGADARPSHVSYHRGARDWCKRAGVAFNMKQWGAWIDHDQPGVDMLGSVRSPMHQWADGTCSVKLAKELTGRQLDGVLHDEFPETP